ncbi:hypothetical protein [Abyssibius alkaniclasticus]|uniref:hypothetical protein n=1 Tax=Abyssibius alkaniclasticus TaxID=2881234 RepID=UPI0040594716
MDQFRQTARLGRNHKIALELWGRMDESLAASASKRFLDAIWSGDPPSTIELTEQLDRLLVCYHDLKGTDTAYPEQGPPERDWRAVYDQAGKRFPDYGLYPTAIPSDGFSGAMGAGDAIDDITDITLEMREVIWYAENYGAAAADTCFRDSYYHWGQHARELLVFLHGKEFG